MKFKKKIRALSKHGLTPLEIARVKATAEAESKKAERQACASAIILMLAIPAMILKEDYWKHASVSKMKKFILDCYSLFDSWDRGHVSNEELYEFLQDECGIDGKAMQEDAIKKYGWEE